MSIDWQTEARQVRLLHESEEFDAQWYRATYPDVVQLGMDPAVHYLRWGARLGRDPGPDFSTRFYLQRYADVAASGINPLLHYLRDGKREGRMPHANGTLSVVSRQGRSRLRHDAPLPPPAIATSRIRCTVVVTVRDAPDALETCLRALFRHTSFGDANQLLILDDASTDERVPRLLRGLSGLRGVRVVRNPENLGYTANANQGCRLAGDTDVVLLNSDTQVGPHWLGRLKQAAGAGDDVGTVTAVSNNAGAFSVPASGSNPLPPDLSADRAARVIADTMGRSWFEVPTGHGFCMYVRRALLQDIGAFDADAFPRGYGEENDFCMRALGAGWRNLVAPDVHVRHAGAQSFGREKQALLGPAMETVVQRHPLYRGAIRGIPASRSLAAARQRIAAALGTARSGPHFDKQRVLFVLSTTTGGIPRTNHDLMRAIRPICDSWALRCDRRVVVLLEATAAGYRELRRWTLPEPIRFATHVSGAHDALFRAILLELGIDVVHVRHLAWHSLHLPRVAHELDVPVVFSLHDFYMLCPSVTLVDAAGRYHPEGVAEGGTNPLWDADPTVVPVTPAVLRAWQARMGRVLLESDMLVTTSNFVREHFLDVMPALRERAQDWFRVVPHGRDFETMSSLAREEDIRDDAPLRVLLPGNLGVAKGSRLVAQVKHLDKRDEIEFHVLGRVAPELRGLVVDHGSYQRSDFHARVAAIEPHVAALFSVVPETWSHTLTESWACGLPVLGVDRGAIGERLAAHGGGWLVDPDPEAIYRKLLWIRASRQERLVRMREVRAWQAGPGRANDTTGMATRYLALYQELVATRRQLDALPCRLDAAEPAAWNVLFGPDLHLYASVTVDPARIPRPWLEALRARAQACGVRLVEAGAVASKEEET